MTISGTKYLDLTGNGFSSDDTPKSGVTINLYHETNATSGLQVGSGCDTLVATTTTASNGTYSFPVSTAGTYYVQEAVPTGNVQTGGGPSGAPGNTYYTVTATPGNSYAGYNFDDFPLDQCAATNISYQVYHNGSWTTVTTLGGNTHQGDTVKVTFTIPAGTTDQVTLVSYAAPSASFSDANAYQQLIYQQATGTFGPGTSSLTVQLPNSYYQVDFVCGAAIDQLEPNQNRNAYGPDSANILYGAQSRLLSADNGGTTAPGSLNTKSPATPAPATSSTGSQALSDSATLAGGYNPGGTIMFYLMAPGATASTPLSQAVYTDAVTVSGNGVYTTATGNNPGGYVATAAGTYQWVVVYSGNGNNNTVTSPFGSEPWNVATPVSITGTVFCDNNLNGSFTAGESLDSGAVVSLLSGNTVLQTTTTDASGMYSFSNLAPGTYTVNLTTPAPGHLAEQTHGSVTVPQSYTVTLGSGGSSANNNFAEIDHGSLSGLVFLDINDSGNFDSGDVGISGATVALTGTNYLGQAVNQSLTTGSGGTYTFSNLLPSNGTGYTLKVTPPANDQNGVTLRV
jgi:hypothetical protein